MNAPYFRSIVNAVKQMHYRHGVGDVKSVHLFADGRVEVTAKGYNMEPHVRKGRITRDGIKATIRMYGTSMTVKEIGE